MKNADPELALSGSAFLQVNLGFLLADLGGFEPPRALTQHGFQPCAIGH